MMDFKHTPVLFAETMAALNIRPDGIYCDMTAGGGGHSQGILERLGENGRLIAVDQDPDAIAAVTARLGHDPRLRLVHANFSSAEDFLRRLDVFGKLDGVLIDCGVSSHQLDVAERGFSYHNDAVLDLRMSQTGTTAAELVNTLPQRELARILRDYGEERYSMQISKAIERARGKAPIETTAQLAEIIKYGVPESVRWGGKHPARKSFLALRAYLNDEPGSLAAGLDAALEATAPCGRICVISFHSLEDRQIKVKMREWAQGCICAPEAVICVCDNKPKVRLVGRKPTEPTPEEIEGNPRSRSAKLRCCEKL